MGMTVGILTCPVCGVEVPVTAELATVSAAGASITASHADVYAHAWTHEQE